jgi:radical SAM superfamily enzyme YgiQ (UPF0313 family)
MYSIELFLEVASGRGNYCDIVFENHIAKSREALIQEYHRTQSELKSAVLVQNAFWANRSFPVLSILSPAMISHEGNIEYPGDPVCLYAGISKMIAGVQPSLYGPFSDHDQYVTHCPQLGRLPDLPYRLAQGNSTKRNIDQSWDRLNTDQTVFDPRAWNAETRQQLRELLAWQRPAIIMISSVSCAHRYALSIAREIKSVLPDSVIVMGGRHADETVSFDKKSNLVNYSYSSTLRSILDGRSMPDVDFVISRDGAYCLDFLMKSLSLAYEPDQGRIEPAHIEPALRYMAAKYGDVRGQSLITWLSPQGPKAILFRGARYTLSEVPHSYYAFAIRAHFPIFMDDSGAVMRTAHVLTTDACPYQCSFCSEGIGVMGRMNKLSRTPADTVITRLKELADFGAQAVFFDDSVMFGGNMTAMRDFSVRLTALKTRLRREGPAALYAEEGFQTEQGAANLSDMQWGAQLTGEFLSTFLDETQGSNMLSLMAKAGCTYVYFGIESLAEKVISRIHKHRDAGLKTPWIDKIRTSLRLVKSAGIQVGSAVLFGLDGENRDTIDETIDGVAALIREGLLDLASPNIMTYHPGTEITRMHQMENQLDYHSASHDVRPPYSYFEQAFPGVVSKHLTEEDIWYIHDRASTQWGTARNSSETTRYEEANNGNV